MSTVFDGGMSDKLLKYISIICASRCCQRMRKLFRSVTQPSYWPGIVGPMKRMFSLVIAIAWLGGCTSSPQGGSAFTWYHPQGGEYLFVFDQDQCESQLELAGQRLGANIQGPFFTCMKQRGYSLLDDQGRLLSAVDSVPMSQPEVVPPKISQQ